MTTWQTFLASLRSDLQDTSGTPRWTTKQLYQFTVDGIRDYSIWFPRRLDRVALTGSGPYTLPDDFVEDIVLESPEDTFLQKRQELPGRKYNKQAQPTLYFVEGGNLYLNGSPLNGAGVLLTYYAVHNIPASETDNTFVFTIPDRDIELPRLFAQAKVHGQMRGKQSRLDRFDPGSGRRDDNPLTPETGNLWDEYYDKIAQRVRGGAVVLYRTGKNR